MKTKFNPGDKVWPVILEIEGFHDLEEQFYTVEDAVPYRGSHLLYLKEVGYNNTFGAHRFIHEKELVFKKEMSSIINEIED